MLLEIQVRQREILRSISDPGSNVVYTEADQGVLSGMPDIP
jgi:hypothetical protein